MTKTDLKFTINGKEVSPPEDSQRIIKCYIDGNSKVVVPEKKMSVKGLEDIGFNRSCKNLFLYLGKSTSTSVELYMVLDGETVKSSCLQIQFDNFGDKWINMEIKRANTIETIEKEIVNLKEMFGL